MKIFYPLVSFLLVGSLLGCHSTPATPAESVAIKDTMTVAEILEASKKPNLTKEEERAILKATVATGATEIVLVPLLSEVTEEQLKADPFIVCAHHYGSMSPPPPPLTGTERQSPLVLMTRQQFNDKIQQSPLWESLYDKDLNWASYGSSYDFQAMFKLIGSSSYIRVYSDLDGRSWSQEQRITRFEYGQHLTQKRIPYGHQLLKQERYEMIELLTMVIEDRAKASELVDTLYQQYLDKVKNKDYLSDGRTIHTYLEYDGKYIAMWGDHVAGYEPAHCNYDVLEKFTIS